MFGIGYRGRAAAVALSIAAALFAPVPVIQTIDLGTAREVAPGISLFHVTDPSLIDPPGVLSIHILRIDPARARLRAALANDEIVGTETVADTASRHGALAAVNAGFFLANGDPAGIFKLGGRLVSDTSRPRGAVGIVRAGDGYGLIFDRVTAGVALVIDRGRGRTARVPIAGVDTTRLLGKLMLFTPAYHEHTDTAPDGLEWTVDGSPPRVTGPPRTAGKTPIPEGGFVLSFGGARAPAALRALTRGTRVRLETEYTPTATPVESWSNATDIVGGAGLLARDGRYVDDWTEERFGKGFVESRHPRTMIGTSADGTIWLAAVDGRQPERSSGMTLLELQALARRLGLTNALNLDGGGSTTMWVSGQVVNSPSDAGGPRKVSDALLVFAKSAFRP
jgi:hypothetical protein